MKILHENIHFCSDLHANHKNIILYDKRPFSSIEEMNESLIKKWNDKVGENGIIYFLGDLSMGGFEKTKEITDRLLGEIHVIMGNHDDYKVLSKLNRFASIDRGYREIWIEDKDVERDGKQQICMSHYPMIVWNRHHRNSWHLHGHEHQSLVNTPFGKEYYKRKVIDVGCNGHNYEPISYTEIKDIMKTRIISTIDHH